MTRSDRGFTLIELLAVMALLGVMMGLGVGFLQRRGNDLDLALSMIRDEVRVAGLVARTRRLPSTVLLEPGRDGDAATVRARILEPVGRWGFESQFDGDSRLVPDLYGGESVPGRFGEGRRSIEGEPIMNLAVSDDLAKTLFDLREGFALHVDVKLDQRAAMVIARLDQNLVLSVDDDLYCEVKAVMRDGENAAGAVDLTSGFPLRLHRWVTITVAQDREYLTLWIDGREAGQVPMRASLFQSGNDNFTVSPADTPVLGIVDEVRVLAYAFTELQVLPVGVELDSQYSRIDFGRDGRVREPVTFGLVFGDERKDFRVTPGGTIE